MIHTYPSAEVSTAIDCGGARNWYWAELGLNIPYFLVTSEKTTADGPVTCHLLCAHLGQLLELAKSDDPSFRILKLQLLSPDYMNGGDCFQLDELTEIWRTRRQGHAYRFVVANGACLEFDPMRVEGVAEEAAERVYSSATHDHA